MAHVSRPVLNFYFFQLPYEWFADEGIFKFRFFKGISYFKEEIFIVYTCIYNKLKSEC